jgi:MFS family permease
MYYVPFYRMSVSGKSATQAGIDLLPASAFLVPGSIIVSILTTRLGRFRWAIWSGWAVSILACGLMLLYNLHTRLAVYSVIMAIFGLGSGMVLTSTNVGIQAISKEEDAGMAGCMYAFFRSVGMPLGVTVSLPLLTLVVSMISLILYSSQERYFKTPCLASCLVSA